MLFKSGQWKNFQENQNFPLGIWFGGAISGEKIQVKDRRSPGRLEKRPPNKSSFPPRPYQFLRRAYRYPLLRLGKGFLLISCPFSPILLTLNMEGGEKKWNGFTTLPICFFGWVVLTGDWLVFSTTILSSLFWAPGQCFLSGFMFFYSLLLILR